MTNNIQQEKYVKNLEKTVGPIMKRVIESLNYYELWDDVLNESCNMIVTLLSLEEFEDYLEEFKLKHKGYNYNNEDFLSFLEDNHVLAELVEINNVVF